jgi:hypothetical protein
LSKLKYNQPLGRIGIQKITNINLQVTFDKKSVKFESIKKIGIININLYAQLVINKNIET